MTTGQNIRRIRKLKGISQKSLAELAGLTVNGLQKIEYDEITPKMTTVHKIAVALGVEDIDLDEHMKEMLQKWNDQIDTTALQKEVALFDHLPNYDEDDIEVFGQFLLLNSCGKQKVSEYIDLLIQKYKK